MLKQKQAPTLAYVRQHKSAILRLAQQYGASDVRVFGSVARGDATQESDIDLLVRFQQRTSLYELSALWGA